MDIAAMSVALSQGNLQQKVGISVAKMAMNQVDTQADAMLEMMAQPHLGATVDISA